MSKVLSHTVLSSKLAITECSDGFWLYDETRGHNLAMRAKTEQEAFVEALSYYQERLQRIESEYKNLNDRVQSFVSQFTEEDE